MAERPRPRGADRAHSAADGEALPLTLCELVLATTNRGKLADFKYLFKGSGIDLVLPEDLGVHIDVEETGTTFEANALLKARAIARACRRPTLADDSGIVAYALGDEPGVYSARYAGAQGDDHANNMKLIERLRGVADRRAAFVCVLALVLPDESVDGASSARAASSIPLDVASSSDTEIIAEGRCEGTVAGEERGTNGFGYDAVFYREDLGCTFGEAAPERKHARSHRAAAVRRLLEELRLRGLCPS